MRRLTLLAAAAALLLATATLAMVPDDAAAGGGGPRPTTKSAGYAGGGVGRSSAAAAPGAPGAPDDAEIDARLAAGQEVKFIVTFKEAAVAQAARAARAEIALERTAAAARAGGTAAAAAADDGGADDDAARVRGLAAVKSAAFAPAGAVSRAGARVSKEYSHLPSAAVAVNSAAALAALRNDPHVDHVQPVGTVTRALTESLPLILQPTAVTNNFLGAGCAVAIIDGGGDWWAADLGSCTAVGAPSPCRVRAAVDFTGAGVSGDPHATNVASTVARLAPGADIILLDVFASSSTTDDVILAAVNWVVANRATYSICAMNLSLGDGSRWPTRCTSSAYEAPFAAAKAGGVLTSVASGNSYFSNGISNPACAPSAVSVGAVHDSAYGQFDSCDLTTYADRVTCFTNIVSWLDMLAPGAKITAGGYTMSGTSMSAPHIAGAAAVLRAAAPSASVDQVIAAMKQGGKQVQDWFTLLWFPRVDLVGALNAIGAMVNMTDTDPPVVSQVRINNGASTALITNVSVSVTASDPSGISTRCASNNNVTALACSPWVPFSTPFYHSLAAGADGPRTVYLFLNDTKGNVMQTPATASITYDADNEPPSSVVVRINNGASSTQNPAVSLTVTGYDLSGLGKMCVSNANVAPAACAPWVGYRANSQWALDSTGGDGARTVYVSLEDRAGNRVVAPTAASIYLDVDDTPPTITSVQINQGDATTGWSRVTITLAATDDRGAGGLKMCVTNDNTAPCTIWATLLSIFPWELAAGEGTRSVFVYARDQVGNVSPVKSDSIVVSTTAAGGPSGTVTINGGVNGYTNKSAVTVDFAVQNGGAPAEYCWSTVDDLAACSTWASAPATGVPLTLKDQGATIVRAIFRDAAARVPGPEATATIIYDTQPPGDVGDVRAAAATPTSVTLSWAIGGAADAGSGRAGFVIAYRTGAGVLPPKCLGGRGIKLQQVTDPDATSAVVSGLARRRVYRFRVCAADRASNVSPGALGVAATQRRTAAVPAPSPSPTP